MTAPRACCGGIDQPVSLSAVVLRWRGIASFVGQFAGTVPPGTHLLVRPREAPDFGYGVYADKDLLGIVVLDPATGDTAERLHERLSELFRPGQ